MNLDKYDVEFEEGFEGCGEQGGSSESEGVLPFREMGLNSEARVLLWEWVCCCQKKIERK